MLQTIRLSRLLQPVQALRHTPFPRRAPRNLHHRHPNHHLLPRRLLRHHLPMHPSRQSMVSRVFWRVHRSCCTNSIQYGCKYRHERNSHRYPSACVDQDGT